MLEMTKANHLQHIGQKRSTSMDFGMPFLLENNSIADAAALAASLGLDFVELNMSFPICQRERMPADDLLALQRKYGIYFTFHLDEEMAPCTFSAPVRAAWQQVAREAIALARQIGAPSVNLHWPRGVYVTLPEKIDFLFNRYRQEYLEHTLRFRDLCQEVSGGDVNVCVENTGGWAPFQQEAVDLLLEAPAFGLTLDVGHNCRAGYADAPYYARHRDRLRHMHLHDATPAQDHMPLGRGSLDIAALLARAGRTHARVVVEVKTAVALEESVDYLRKRGLYHG